MLIISPRSYVTAAFDLLFPHLLSYVFDNLSKKTRWWKECVYENKDRIFINAGDIRNQINENIKPKKSNDLLEYFDEHSLCKLVLSYPAKKNFSKKDIIIFKELLDIRIEWAHRKHLQTNSYNNEREWAEDSIKYIRDKVENFCNNHNTKKRVSILLFKMKCDWIDDDTKLRSHHELLEWISDNVVNKVTSQDSHIDDLMKNRIIKSFDELKKYADAVSPKTAPRYVIDYYWNAIRNKIDVYEEISKDKNIPSFEDVVEEFTEFCYGK